MSKIRVVFKNISWLTISQVINSVCAFFWTLVIANYLGVEKYGIISFATSFIGIAIIFIDFGMTTYVTREVARDKKRLEEYTPKYLQRCKSQFPQTQNKVANSVHLIGWL